MQNVLRVVYKTDTAGYDGEKKEFTGNWEFYVTGKGLGENLVLDNKAVGTLDCNVAKDYAESILYKLFTQMFMDYFRSKNCQQ